MPDLRSRRVLARGTPRSIMRELGAFGVVGAVSFVLDLGLFQLLYASLGVDAVGAKLTSTLVAMTVAYLGHRYWSFAHRERTGVRRSYLLFAAVNGATLLMGLTIVWLVRYPLGQESALVLQAANVASIGLGTAIRFTAYRRWVFPAADVSARDVPARDVSASDVPAPDVPGAVEGAAPGPHAGGTPAPAPAMAADPSGRGPRDP